MENTSRFRIRIAPGFWTSRYGIALLCTALAVLLVGTSVFAYYYIQFSRLINDRLTGQIFQNTSRLYGAPGGIFVGESLHPKDLATYLLRAGYQETDIPGSPGVYKMTGSTVEIKPSMDSYFHGGNGLRVSFSPSAITRISQLSNNVSRDAAEIEPEVITNLFDSSREKRRVVRFDDLPKVLTDAVIATEDKRFFEHGGLDWVRVFGAALADFRVGQKAQGASTIDMQVARSFFFTTKREWRRKIKEVLMAIEIDHRFTKQQVFELYANEVYLGNRGSFSIRGFGEAAEAYFGKDVRDLTLGEAAFLGGIIRAPNHYATAERHMDRAIESRDRVLTQMVENSYITADEAAAAKKVPLKFVSGGIESSSAPYFVDMVKDHLLEKFSENDLQSQSYRIYTTLDPSLQRLATVAVHNGMEQIDKLLAKRYAAWKKAGQQVPQPQIALVALDPRTGEIRALVGGRNYGESQLNHALARRQPGSVFKPFVYAAAFDNAAKNLQPVVTPVTIVDDVPTTFQFDGKEYTPDNFGQEFYGAVTVQDALIHSLNVATVKVAEMIGYQRVVELARQMGLGNNIMATPAVALGAYEMTPVEVAAGYTAFATMGTRAEPLYLRSVVSADGKLEESDAVRTRPVLDPRVAFLTTSLMEGVISRGTGASVRSLGFTAPAAGKTGTSHDGWFAGFTSNLLCVIWIGFDDNRDLGLSGSQTAAPIWAEFMKRAVALPAYKNTQDFEPPPGVIQEAIDPQSGQLASSACSQSVQEYFIAGTEPTEVCDGHGGHPAQAGQGSWLSHLFGKGSNPPPPPAPNSPAGASNQANAPGKAHAKNGSGSDPAQPPAADDPAKKKGVLDKIFGIFGGSKKPADSSKPQP
jgi:penicillin-binding protein 1B